MNNKGFTIIELLAVIIILAIILVVAVPSVLNAVEVGKRKAFILSQEKFIDEAKKYSLRKNVAPDIVGSSSEILLTDLINEGYINKIVSPYDTNEECDGYVSIYKVSEDVYNYSSHLDCFNGIENSSQNRLIVHYKFEDFQEPTTNEYNYPTFNTAAGTGGWSHWAQAGGIGTYGQNTDTNYIYDDQPYSHWYANGAGATGNYLLYQSPAFDGGFRSLSAIIKMEDGSEVTNSKIFPAWNASTAQSIPSGTWTSIKSLGNGFYLCKADGIHQDGSNDLVGMYVRQSYKAYVSWAQLEQKKGSTPFVLTTRTGTITDYSDNNNVAPLSMTLTPRWINKGYYFNGTNSEVSLPNNIITTSDIRLYGLTYSIWIKPESLTEQRIIGQQISSGYSDYSNGGLGISSTGKAKFIAYSDANPVGYITATGNTTLKINEWTHIAGVYDYVNNVLKIFVNGKIDSTPIAIGTFSRLLSIDANRIGKKEHATPYYYKGYLDEVRIYNRVLSDGEILGIYDGESNLFNN